MILVIVVGGIWWLSDQEMKMQAATQMATTTPTVSVASNAQFPAYLAAANGMALYTFKNDTPGVSNCSGTCITEWPAYTVPIGTSLTAATNVPGTLGTITRSDGTMQVTYNGLPLYFWIHDMKPGDVTGNGQDNFAIALPTQMSTQAAAPAPAKTSTPKPAAVTPAAQPAPVQQTPAPAPAPAPTPSPTPAYNY